MANLNPLSVIGGLGKGKDTESQDGNNPVDTQSIPRSAAGVVTDTGDIVNQAGETVGKLTESQDPTDLVGNTVTATGDVVDSAGGILSKADLNDDVSEYTTEHGQEEDSGEKQEDSPSLLQRGKGLFGAVSGVTKTVGGVVKLADGTLKPVTNTLGLSGDGKGEVVTEQGEHIPADQIQEVAEGADAEKLVKEEGADIKLEDHDAADAEGLKDAAQDKVEGAEGEVGDKTEELKDGAEAAAEGDKPTDEIQDAVEGEKPTDELKDNIEGEAPTDELKDTIEGEKPTDELKDTIEGEKPTDELKETVEGEKPADELKDTIEGEKPTDELKETVEGEGENLEGEAKDAVEGVAEGEDLPIDFSVLKGTKVNKGGNLVNDDGEVIGRVIEGDPKKIAGKIADEEGNIWNDAGKIVGKAEPIPDTEREDKQTAPFENFPDAVIEADGRVLFEGRQVGTVIEGDPKKLKGSKVDEDGDILDRNGNVVGKAEAWDEPEPEPEEVVDRSILNGKRVNKAGNVVDSNGDIYGRIVEGILAKVVGRMCDKDGNIRSESGDVIGRAELVPESEREAKKSAPFENFPDAVVEADGRVLFEGRQVGTVIEGDPKKLKGSRVDEDGDILDRNGNVVGKAEAWDEPEPEPEEVIDRSILAGKRVNKAGNVVDSSGTIYGRVIEGNVSSMIGRMCDKEGNVRSEAGDVIGKAELVPEGEREGSKEGPFAELEGCTVTKEGKVVTPGGDVVGRLVSGDPKVLFGRTVDEDGDVVDRNGNVLAKAERWEEPEVEKRKDPLAGRRVNREGNVVDEDGNIIGKLTSGDINICAGKEIDDDGDVLNSKGQSVGHVNLIQDIPEPEPEETEEERQAREKAEKDKELAGQLAGCIEQSLEKIRPICKRITEKVDKAERTPKEELDEEELVKQVKPLIEDGGKILTETNGIIRGMDPDGRIQRNAKQKSATREATPEEYHLAEVLKELTGTVTECIDNAKRKIEDMPHAKKELSPLWGLLAEPLFQILAAVGLLLNGVLGLVGRLLSGLGLGGLVDGLLGGLGVTKILDSLGLGSITGSLTGKKKK